MFAWKDQNKQKEAGNGPFRKNVCQARLSLILLLSQKKGGLLVWMTRKLLQSWRSLFNQIASLARKKLKKLCLGRRKQIPIKILLFEIKFILKIGPFPASFVLISVFSNKHYNSYIKCMWKMYVHSVYGTGIWTHDLWITSLLP